MGAAGRGRNLLVCQLGGPTAVINASLAGVIEAGRAADGVGTVLGAHNGVTGVIEGDLLDLGAEDPDTVAGLRGAPGAALGSARREVTEEDYEQILDTLDAADVGYCLFIGGNGTMALAGEVADRVGAASLDVRIAGVPKTVDNDIAATDHCPGYGSAARYYATTVREVGRDVESLPPPVTIFETMGRDTGWLAAATALAGPERDRPPHLVYLPERPFEESQFLDDVAAAYEEHGFVLAAVGEGLRDADGDPVAMGTSEAQRDATGKPLPGGVGERLATLVGSELGLRARCEKPGLCGRASIAHQSETDRREAERVGAAAVDYVTDGESGAMMALRRDGDEYAASVEPVSLSEVSGARELPDRYVADAGNDVTEAFIEYARPLAGGDLPEYARLDGVAVDL
jgi:6-phosphofructokinase 1